MLPDWAPALHPLVVHFPIALLFTAVLVDSLGFFLKSRPWLQEAATGLFVLGAAAALVAYFSGKAAADLPGLSADVAAAVDRHADWALYTVWCFALLALLRVAFRREGEGSEAGLSAWVHGVLFAIGLLGLVLVHQTAERGAELVYRYGVGVQAVEERSGVDAPEP